MSDFCTDHYLLFPCRKCASGAPPVPPAHSIGNEERYRRALDDIGYHFDDQGFPRHSDVDDCGTIMVNFANAVLDGYDGGMGTWYAEEFRNRDE